VTGANDEYMTKLRRKQGLETAVWHNIASTVFTLLRKQNVQCSFSECDALRIYLILFRLH